MRELEIFLVIVSLITSNWRLVEQQIDHADIARIDQQLQLRPITIDQATALWASRLAPIHKEAVPTPSSPIAPLTKHWLEYKYPGGKVSPSTRFDVG